VEAMGKSKKDFSQKVLQTLHLEKPAVVILNKITARYEYPYLKGVESRGETLFGLIKSFLRPGDNFLDIMCGYSPLASPLLRSGYQITGFDDNRNAIKDLKKLYPDGKWIRSSFGEFKPKSNDQSTFSVFLLLGAFELCGQQSFLSLMTELLKVNKPRVFFLETNRSIEKAPTIDNPLVEESALTRSVHLTGYNSMMKLLMDWGYEVADVGQYDAHLKEEWATIRIYAILRAKS
jgi:2-polyprenyl-3-methyl-5-hydroxy-6-metoxy-1,4-benzoquinol methylase